MLSGGVKYEAPSMGSKNRGRKAKVKRKVIFEKKQPFMSLIDLHKKNLRLNLIYLKKILLGKASITRIREMLQFTVINSIEIQAVSLDNLIQRGFPMSHIRAICLLQKDVLDEIAAKSMQSIQFISITTAIEEKSPTGLLGPWKYINSATVIITNLVNETPQDIRLDNLLNRGFPRTEKKFRYYSFLQFKHLVKA